MKGIGEGENRLHAETGVRKRIEDWLRFQQVSAMTWLALQSSHYQTPSWTVMGLTHVSADSRGGLLMKDVLIIDQAVPTSEHRAWRQNQLVSKQRSNLLGRYRATIPTHPRCARCAAVYASHLRAHAAGVTVFSRYPAGDDGHPIHDQTADPDQNESMRLCEDRQPERAWDAACGLHGDQGAIDVGHLLRQ